MYIHSTCIHANIAWHLLCKTVFILLWCCLCLALVVCFVSEWFRDACVRGSDHTAKLCVQMVVCVLNIFSHLFITDTYYAHLLLGVLLKWYDGACVECMLLCMCRKLYCTRLHNILFVKFLHLSMWWIWTKFWHMSPYGQKSRKYMEDLWTAVRAFNRCLKYATNTH